MGKWSPHNVGSVDLVVVQAGPGEDSNLTQSCELILRVKIPTIACGLGTLGYWWENQRIMKYSTPGLGRRLRRARDGTGLSQEKVGKRIGVSWMTVLRWERSQRSVPDHLLARLCELYDKPARWFLALEDGDVEQDNGPTEAQAMVGASSAVAIRLSRRIADAPVRDRQMIEKVVEDLLDGLGRVR